MNENIKDRGIFSKISEKTRESLMSAGNVITLKKGEELFGERQEVKSLYIVLDGYMSLYRNSRYGEIKIIFICTDGEILNEVVLQDEKTSICTRALSDTKLLVIHRNEMFKILEQDHNLTITIYESLAMKTRRLYHQVGNANGTYPLEKRLAAKIWKLSRDYGVKTDEGTQIAFETTVTFLANMLGAKRETISRLISQMKKDGVIQHENGFLTVLDRARLKEIAQ